MDTKKENIYYNQDILSIDTEIICWSKALISCFTLFFPELHRKSLFLNTLNIPKEEEQTWEKCVDEFNPSLPYGTIESLKNWFLYQDNSPKWGLGLFRIFCKLYSDDIEVETRATLISTFRALRLSLVNEYGEEKIKENFDAHVKQSYDLFCETILLTGQRTDFTSKNILGSLVEDKMPRDNDASINSYEAANEGILIKCKKIQLDWKHYRIVTENQKRIFLTSLYNGLQDFSKDPVGTMVRYKKKLNKKKNIDTQISTIEQECKKYKEYEGVGVLSFPDKEYELSGPVTRIPNSQYYPKQCNLENFCNMFEGVTEAEPYRTELCKNAKAYCLSCFITALDCPKGNREIVENGIKELIVLPDGKGEVNDLRRTKRHKNLMEAYKIIIDDAKKNALSTNR